MGVNVIGITWLLGGQDGVWDGEECFQANGMNLKEEKETEERDERDEGDEGMKERKNGGGVNECVRWKRRFLPEWHDWTESSVFAQRVRVEPRTICVCVEVHSFTPTLIHP